MTYDSLTNNAANRRITAESGVFGGNSIVYNSISEISEAKPVDHTNHLMKSGVATGLCLYLLLILLLLNGRIRRVIKMFSDYRFTKKQYQESSRLSAVNTSYIILFTMIVVAIQYRLMTDYQEYNVTGISFLALPGVFLLQSAALKLTALICKSEDILGEINLNRKLYLSVLGIVISPVTVLTLLYEGTGGEKIALIISEILFVMLILLMMIRLMKVFDDAKVSYFFRFLYLCTLEISPYLALFIVFENIN